MSSAAASLPTTVFTDAHVAKRQRRYKQAIEAAEHHTAMAQQLRDEVQQEVAYESLEQAWEKCLSRVRESADELRDAYAKTASADTKRKDALEFMARALDSRVTEDERLAFDTALKALPKKWHRQRADERIGSALPRCTLASSIPCAYNDMMRAIADIFGCSRYTFDDDDAVVLLTTIDDMLRKLEVQITYNDGEKTHVFGAYNPDCAEACKKIMAPPPQRAHIDDGDDDEDYWRRLR